MNRLSQSTRILNSIYSNIDVFNKSLNRDEMRFIQYIDHVTFYQQQLIEDDLKRLAQIQLKLEVQK